MSRKKSDSASQANKQKLNACLKAKKLPTVSLMNGRTERWVRNVAGRAINTMIAELTAETVPPSAVLEKLSVADMRMKSRDSNRRA